MRRAVKIRLYPNKTQQEFLQKHFGAIRYIYNRFLALKKYSYQKFGANISADRLIKRLPILKKRHEWLKEIDSQALQQSIRHLDEAFKHFFRRVKNGKTPGFPKCKSKKHGKQNFAYPQRVKIQGKKIYLPKIGWIKAKGLRDDLVGKIKTDEIFFLSCLHTKPITISSQSIQDIQARLAADADTQIKRTESLNGGLYVHPVALPSMPT